MDDSRYMIFSQQMIEFKEETEDIINFLEEEHGNFTIQDLVSQEA